MAKRAWAYLSWAAVGVGWAVEESIIVEVLDVAGREGGGVAVGIGRDDWVER